MKKALEAYLEKEIQKVYNKYNIKLNPMNYDLKDRVLIYKDIGYLHSEKIDTDSLYKIASAIVNKFPKPAGYNCDVFRGKYIFGSMAYLECKNDEAHINDVHCNFILHNNLIMDIEKLVYDTLKKPYEINKELGNPEKVFDDEVYKEAIKSMKYYMIPIVLGRLDSSLIDVLEYVFVDGNDLCTATEFKNLDYLRNSLATVKDTGTETNLYLDIDLATVQAPRYLINNDDAVGGYYYLCNAYEGYEEYFKNCYSRAFVYMAEILNNLKDCNLDKSEIDDVVYTLLDKSGTYSYMFINNHFFDYTTNTYNPRVEEIINEDDLNKRFRLLVEYAKYIESEINYVALRDEHLAGLDYIPHIFASVVQTLEDYSKRTRLIKTYLMLMEFCKANGIELAEDADVPNLGLEVNSHGAVGVSMQMNSSNLLDLGTGAKYTTPTAPKKSLIDKPTIPAKDKISQLKATSDILDRAKGTFNDGKYDYDVEYVKEPTRSGDPRLQGYNRLVSSIKLLNKNLIKQIRDIKTYNTGGKLAGLTKGKLDNKNLYRYQDTPNIFYNNQYKIKEMDLAFGILLDVSGSMRGEGVENGKITMILLHETLKSLGINHCICTHNSNGMYECNIKKYQPFKEDKNYTVDKCYSLFDIEAYGGNCDSGALYYMQKEFSRVRNKDKICIIFSDGEPTECTDTDLKDQIATMERHGIRVIGIGIDFESIKEYYPHNANGANLKQMLDIVTGILKEYVLEKVE